MATRDPSVLRVISPKLATAAAAPLTLVSLRRVGFAGLAMANLIVEHPLAPSTPLIPRTARGRQSGNPVREPAPVS